VLIEQGDLVIITRGAEHSLFCDPKTEPDVLELDTVLEQSGFDGKGALVIGEVGKDHETQLVCGHFAFASDLTHPLIEALPPLIHIRNYGETSGQWMESTLRIIGAEAGRDALGGDVIALKLSEIIFAQALRDYLRNNEADQPVLAGFNDPKIARVLQAMHQTPARQWTVDDLAKVGGLSRTSFASRFGRLMDMTPMAYITLWRMQIAARLLRTTDEPIIQVAEQVGYGSEAAFGRVFKKHQNVAPATFRRLAG
jgi:AraC-like DNA-binding protein